jgi:hypothetical protein
VVNPQQYQQEYNANKSELDHAAYELDHAHISPSLVFLSVFTPMETERIPFCKLA